MNKSHKILPAVLGPASFIMILAFFHPEGLSEQGVAVLACTSWIAIWWIFEVLHISSTALLPIVLFPLSGALDISSTTASYGHKYVFLYMGGFMLAIALEKWNLHRRIALNIINFIGSGISSIILGFMLATAFLSMWISNTATSVMMLPIGLAIVSQLKDNPDTAENEHTTFGKALMLAIAYSASVGGIATLIGTPPNLVLAGVVQETYGIEITFIQWLSFGLPISLTLLAICWVYLTKFAFSFEIEEFPGGRPEIKRQLNKLGPMSKEEYRVSAIFLFAALLWIIRPYIKPILPALDDSMIAIMAGLLLFIFPASSNNEPLMKWEEAVKMPWGIIILFGGGMALASGFDQSGLALWIGSQASLLDGLPIMLLILVLVTAVNFLTEVTSNLATTAMLLPILAPIAFTLGIHPYALLVPAAIAASCAFMLPVATPPNAVVFGSGYLRIPDMVKAGIWMNTISIALISLAVYFFLEAIWGIDISAFPESLIPPEVETE
ncbi:MAG: SLC13 family permease [Bacteroidota bacterium]